MGNRLDTEEAFAVRTKKAATFFPKDAPLVEQNELRDYYTNTGYHMVRADTIRRHHPDYTPARPLKGREEELVEEMTHHPFVLAAVRKAKKIREDIESTSVADMGKHGRLKSDLEQIEQEIEKRQKRISGLLSEKTGSLSGEEMNILLDRNDIESGTKTITSLDGETFRSESPSPRKAWRNWPTPIAQALYRDLPRHLLRFRAHQLERRPDERSMGQHVAAIGVERLLDEDPHFRRDPHLGKSENGQESESAENTTPISIPSTGIL